MPILDLYSRRKRAAEQKTTDVYVYDALPLKVRVQIIHALNEILQTDDVYDEVARDSWTAIRDITREEMGVFVLVPHRMYDSPREEVTNWFLNETDIDSTLDGLELSLRCIDRIARGHYSRSARACDQAIQKINFRLREAGIGYQYSDELLVQVSSEFLHSQTVAPALSLLRRAGYEAADAEFREAHTKFRAGKYEDSLTDCCKALESVLKVICAKQGWAAKPTDTAARLLEHVLSKGLIPEYLTGQFNALRALLEAGTPTVRNKSSGHGAGTAPREVSERLAAYQLHQTAAALVFLIESERALA